MKNKKEYQFVKYNDYIHIYTFKNIHSENTNEIYAVLIDKTRHISPLFFYCNSSTTEKKRFRIEALTASLEEILEKFDEFESIFTEDEELFRENDFVDVKNILCARLNQLTEEDD